MNTLLEFCNSTTPIKLSVTKDETLLKWKELLFQTTEFLDFYDNPPLALRYYCILNNITEIPNCICGNKVLYKKYDPKLGFAQFCSPTCSRSNKDSNKNYQKYIQDYDWLYNQRITLQKSKEQIAKELGCSTIPITKWLEKHNIENRKPNVRNTKIKLPPKEELENLYFNDMLTLVDIGVKYDVSNVTVKKWFKEYNISLLPHSETIRLKVKEKIEKTNIERYGVNQVFSLPHVQEKIRNTFIDKYGVPYHPYGEEFIIKNLLDYCKENNLKNYNMVRGIQTSGGYRCFVLPNYNNLSENEKNELISSIKQKIKYKKIKMWVAISPQGVVYEFNNITKFCSDKNINCQNLGDVALKKLKSIKGWRCFSIVKYI